MKRVSLIVAVAVSAILIGCQDSSNVNPISNDLPRTSASKIMPSTPDGAITLNGYLGLNASEGVDNSYVLNGTVQFTVFASDENAFSLSLVTDASLESLADQKQIGRATGESIDQVQLSTKEATICEKVYRMTGLNKDIDLHLQFSVTPDDVQLAQMWIEEGLPHGRISATK